ncbi:MAG: metallophosphoesterase [Duodenibacillus sp.]|nr:metallophosphoesterase [Duodenibacillus sp.]
MRICYASDLHMEYAANRAYVREHAGDWQGDVLLLAGDIQELANPSLSNDFWDWCAANFRETLIVPGNHEYGHGVVPAGGGFTRYVRDNVAYHHNRVVRLDDVDFVCSTLWPVPGMAARAFADQVLPYFNEPGVPSIDTLNAECVDFVFNAVRRSEARATVIVTHFAPTPDVVPPAKAVPEKLGVFACDLTERIRREGPDVWLFGHSHTNVDQRIGATRLIANQLGNLERQMNEAFAFGKDFVL